MRSGGGDAVEGSEVGQGSLLKESVRHTSEIGEPELQDGEIGRVEEGGRRGGRGRIRISDYRDGGRSGAGSTGTSRGTHLLLEEEAGSHGEVVGSVSRLQTVRGTWEWFWRG